MKLKLTIIAVALMAVGCTPPPQPVTPAPTRWEYKTVDIPDPQLDIQMNALGAQGWEAVYARRADIAADAESPYHVDSRGDYAYEIMFKRPIGQRQ